MSIIGIDIGSSTTKIIEYDNNKIKNKKIIREKYSLEKLREFLEEHKINDIEKFVFTGIGADNINEKDYNAPIHKVDEFKAIAKGGLVLGDREEAIVVSVGTGTALIEATKDNVRHLGGSGVGAGTLFNLCEKLLGVKSYDEIFSLAEKGNIEKIDLRIGDVTDKEIITLPKDLTLSNFGKFQDDAKKEDIVLGFVNMVFEVIGMMAAFTTINSNIKEAILIGNITALPGVAEMLKKIEYTHKIKFIVPENVEFGVALGAIKSVIK